MRDTIRTKEYFNEMIEFDQSVIDRDKDTVNEVKLHEGRAITLSDLTRKSVNLCIQRYSRGDAIADIEPNVRQMLAMFALRAQIMPTLNLEKGEREMWENLGISKLFNILTCLSFVTALRFPTETVLKLLRDIGHAGEDGLLDRVAVKLGDSQRKVAAKAKYGMEYDPLVEVIDAPAEARPALLKTYVDNWYKKHMKDMAWHNTHKGEAYVGYWCFDVALVVMLWGIDDTSFASHKHYPADLVRHYRGSR